VYGFALRMKEKMDTIPSLWATVEEWALAHGRKQHLRFSGEVQFGQHFHELAGLPAQAHARLSAISRVIPELNGSCEIGSTEDDGAGTGPVF
jgi:hypothetical protein